MFIQVTLLMSECLLCEFIQYRKYKIITENRGFCSFYDENPVSQGHAMVVPKRHFASPQDLTNEELLDMHLCIGDTRAAIEKRYKPDGYNIGINDGGAAGQTIFHMHVHVIPRYTGDVENPIGGIRNIFPGKGDYTKLK